MKKVLLVIFQVIILSSIVKAEERIFYADGPKDKKAVALTFDDGPGVNTQKVIEILKKHNAKATFFMEGSCIETNPASAKLVQAGGYEIGSHLYSHPDFWNYPATPEKTRASGTTDLSDDKGLRRKPDYRELWNQEADKSEKAFQKLLGFKPKLMRMPHGYVKPWVKEEAKKRGYILINWTCGYDWHKMTSEQMAAEYIKCIKPGAVFLMHDGGKNRQRTLEALEIVITELEKRGYKMVTVSELLSLGKAPEK